MSSSHLAIKDLWHKYDSYSEDAWVLKSIDLDLFTGELVGLLGPSGCGKTTLLRLIAGFEKPAHGSIFLNGIEISSSNNVLPAEKRGIGMVFQDYALFPHLNAWKNVCFGLPRNSDLSRAEWLLELLDLTNYRSRYPHEMSGGQKQRLALARALAPGNSLIVLDEPFCSLDVEVRGRLRNQLANVLNTCSATGLLVTHDPQEALAICDRVAVMNSGEFHQVSKPLDIVSKPSTSFVGKFVLQNNLLPINSMQPYIQTPIGKLITSLDFTKFDDNPEACMFNSNDVIISNLAEHNAMVIAKEFCNDHWKVILKIENSVIKVWHPLEYQFSIGSSCNVQFKESFEGILFPGSIKCDLKKVN